MVNKKRRQHYVFQAYLKAWTKNNKIWCVRPGDKPFNTPTTNVAVEHDFYRTKELNDDERKFFEHFLLTEASADVRKALLEHVNLYQVPIEMQKSVHKLRQFFESSFNGNENMSGELNNSLLELEKTADIGVNNAEEDYHSIIEGESIKWLESLKRGELHFYNTTDKNEREKKWFEDEKHSFLYFICLQYFRTKAIKERWISSFEPCLNKLHQSSLNISADKISLENLVHPFFWYTTNACAYNLRKANTHLTLLVNKTDMPFITSDQPVINIKANYHDLSEELTELVFYYPIAPNTAILINDNNNESKIELIRKQVDEYNWAIVNSSYENIFANSVAILERYGLG